MAGFQLLFQEQESQNNGTDRNQEGNKGRIGRPDTIQQVIKQQVGTDR